jgi:hypothetical protein
VNFWQFILGIFIGLVGIGLLLRYDKKNNPQPREESNKTGMWSWIIGIGTLLMLLSPHFRKKIKEYIFGLVVEKPEQQEQETEYTVKEEPAEDNPLKGTPFDGRDKHGKAFVSAEEFQDMLRKNPDLKVG